MSFKKMMRNAGLFESWSQNSDLNNQIESLIASYDADKQAMLEDALSILKAHGTQGMTVGDWKNQLAGFYPEAQNADLTDALKTLAFDFKVVVKKIADKTFMYSDDNTGPQVDMNDPRTRQMQSFSMLTATAVDIIEKAGAEGLTKTEWVMALADKMNIHDFDASQIIVHLMNPMNPMSNSFVQEGDKYIMKHHTLPKEGPLDFLKGLTKKP